MTTLKEHLADCLKLAEADPANLDRQMFARHGSSGDCSELGSPHVSDRVDDCGPFDLEEGEKYISIYIGN